VAPPWRKKSPALGTDGVVPITVDDRIGLGFNSAVPVFGGRRGY
jgi:hypothetical protein